jgi:hypothetical protein
MVCVPFEQCRILVKILSFICSIFFKNSILTRKNCQLFAQGSDVWTTWICNRDEGRIKAAEAKFMKMNWTSNIKRAIELGSHKRKLNAS